MKNLSIIGFGRFGKLIAKILKEDFLVFVSDKIDKSKDAEEAKVKLVSIEEASKKDIIILAVPISEIEITLKKIKEHIKEGVLVLDTCSVKEYPMKIMENFLPIDSVEIIGTHPMFGPDSFHDKEARKIVLCQSEKNKKTGTINKVKDYLEKKGFKAIITTPEYHDKQIAETLCFTHFLGRGLIDIGLKEKEIDTLGHKRLLKILETVENDSETLFYDMHKYNKYAKEIREKFIKSLERLNDIF